MAEPHFDPSQVGEKGARLSPEKARQGQNVKGMVAVLVAGTVLVAGIYAVMLAMQAKPSSETEAGKAPAEVTAPAAPSQ